jgi:hypothetical protein
MKINPLEKKCGGAMFLSLLNKDKERMAGFPYALQLDLSLVCTKPGLLQPEYSSK